MTDEINMQHVAMQKQIVDLVFSGVPDGTDENTKVNYFMEMMSTMLCASALGNGAPLDVVLTGVTRTYKALQHGAILVDANNLNVTQ